MKFTNLLSLASLLGLSTAHFHVLYPEWRADSLTTKTASQWLFPCKVSPQMQIQPTSTIISLPTIILFTPANSISGANISETTDLSNRTQWPVTGGSLSLQVSHPWALTYVNLGIGTNVSSFNISLVNGFNQTGNGTFCLKETGKAALAAGLAKANLSAETLEGMQGSLQIIQIASTGASLFNVCRVPAAVDVYLELS